MQASQVLTARVVEGVVFCSAKGSASVAVIGASAPVSIRRHVPTNAFTIAPEKGKRSLIAVVTYTEPGTLFRLATETPFLLAIDWQNDQELRIDLDREFVSSPGRLGQVRTTGIIDVKAQEKIFTTEPDLPETFYVPDGNLLCQYLIGDVDADAVEAVAQQQAATISRIEELERRNSDLASKLDELRTDHVCLRMCCASLEESNDQLREALQLAQRPWYRRFLDFLDKHF